MAFLDGGGARLDALAADGRHVLLTGDLNVAHREADLKNWKGNLRKSGLPAAGARLVRPAVRRAAAGWTSYRAAAGPGPGPYSWWSWRGKGVRPRLGLADRLPDRLGRAGGACRQGRDRPGAQLRRALERPRARRRPLRYVTPAR